MEKQNFIPTMRLNGQFSLNVTEKAEAEIVYHQIKCFLSSFDANMTLNGQVLMMLEPCCKERKNQP